MKTLKFVGMSRDDLRAFSVEAKYAVGMELRQVQNGSMPTDWKPMPGIGAGVYELRVHEAEEWRVIYVAKLSDAVYVLHAFQKKGRKTR